MNVAAAASGLIPLDQALQELEALAPGVPLLALGQTVFWDEPVKVGVLQRLRALGLRRALVAGVHDTDYFAKLPGARPQPGRFLALPHNDTTTKGLWSAAAEFSALFASETWVTREKMMRAGSRLEMLQRARPQLMDEATEAWGWRGIVSLADHAPITADVPLPQVFPELMGTLDWAFKLSLEGVAGPGREVAEETLRRIRTHVCDASDDNLTLGTFYKRLLPQMYAETAGMSVTELLEDGDSPLQVSATTELLRFNRETASQPRFELVGAFVDPAFRAEARRAYNRAVQGTGLYELERFGAGAVPFDLVVPGKGRGTLRLGARGAVIQTPEPLFLSWKKPPTTVQELAAAVEAKFGPDCALIGKAVTLIGMLAREFVFLFHEGASGYVDASRRLHEALGAAGRPVRAHPILRVRYETWDALSATCAWLRLPEPMREPFGTEEICGPSLAQRWRGVVQVEEELLAELGRTRRPIDLIRLLEQRLGGSWRILAEEYQTLHGQLEGLRAEVDALRDERHRWVRKRKELRAARVQAERAKGEHFRAHVFEKEPSPADLAERERLDAEVRAVVAQIAEADREIRRLMREQTARTQTPEAERAHERRRGIELEAELRRLRLIRSAVLTARGLPRANFRPSGWWFPAVSPEGSWFQATVRGATAYFQPL